MLNITLQFPTPPTKANAVGHWKKHKRMQDDFFSDFWFQNHELLSKLRRKKEFPWPFWSWHCHMKMKNYADSDNLVAMCKWPIDAVVNFGLADDDNWKVCRAHSWPTQEIDRKKGALSEITIYPAKGAFLE